MINMIANECIDNQSLTLLYRHHLRLLKPNNLITLTPSQITKYSKVLAIVSKEMNIRGLIKSKHHQKNK